MIALFLNKVQEERGHRYTQIFTEKESAFICLNLCPDFLSYNQEQLK